MRTTEIKLPVFNWKLYGFILLSAITFVEKASAQKEFDGLRGTHKWMMFDNAPNALYHHLADQAFDCLHRRSTQVASIQTLAGWQQKQKQVQLTLREVIGNFPEKTALKPVVTKILHQKNYRVENLYFESQPGFYVTASLFIPTPKKAKKMPAVIYCSGHSEAGYRTASYQHTILNLVSKGFIVLAFDPIGQGERLQYTDNATGKSKFEYPSYEHSYAGAQLFMTGSSLAKYMIWDGIRAVDYLHTRREVDTSKIGITGRSGGGTQSALIAAFDPRIKAVAPENYFTSLTWLYRSMGPQDAEQNFLSGIKKGLDMADLLLAIAPKPVLMITTTRDMFPIQGAIETADEVARIYKAYGNTINFKMVTDDAPHAATKKNREAMYAFFQRFLGLPGDSIDHEMITFKPAELKVTTTGQTTSALKSETVFSLNKRLADIQFQQLQAKRSNPNFQANVLKSAMQCVGYYEPDSNINPVFTGRIQRKDYIISKYFIKGEGNYVIPYLLMKPNKSSSKAIIYLNPKGKAIDSEVNGQMEWLVNNGYVVLAPDLIGTGEMGPGVFKGDSFIDSVSYNLWFSAILIGRSIVGIHASDIVKLERLLTQQNIKQVFGLAHRELAPALLHAAAFDKNIQQVALIHSYSSYGGTIIGKESYHPSLLYSTVAGSSGVYDLPDLAASLAPRKLLYFGADGGTGPIEDMKVVVGAYGSHKDQLTVVSGESAGKLMECLKDWIR